MLYFERKIKMPFFIVIVSLFFLGEGIGSALAYDLRKEPIKDKAFADNAVMAIVSLDNQTISLYDKQGQKLKSSISSGQMDYETPVGIYSVLQKKAEHYSNIYDDAAMPFMQRITWSGISLHAGELPGYPASHGCIRLPYNFAQKIFGLTRLGMRVIVARNEVSPKSIIHPSLFQPHVQNLDDDNQFTLQSGIIDETILNENLLPNVEKWPLRFQQQQDLKQKAYVLNLRAQEFGALVEVPKNKVEELTQQRDEVLKQLKLAEASKRKFEKDLIKIDYFFKRTKNSKEMTEASNKRFAIFEKVESLDYEILKIQGEIKKANEALQDATEVFSHADAKYKEALLLANEAKLRMLPISVLVSLKNQRVYVRQGLEQIMESEINIHSPEQPIGTHIYTALEYNEAANKVHWNVVSLPKSVSDLYYVSSYEDQYTNRRSLNDKTQNDLGEAFEALQRIQFPPALEKRVSEFVWPGSSLIITDEEPHKETGKATEFVVLMSGEPQGGILKRTVRNTYNSYDYYWGGLFDWADGGDRRRFERERRRYEKEMRRQEKRRQRYWFE